RLGQRAQSRIDPHRDGYLPFERQTLLERVQTIRENPVHALNVRFQSVDEHPELALLDRESALDAEQTAARSLGRVLAKTVGDALKLESDPGERLEDSVVQIAGDASPLFARGHRPT